tara:strand:+ start:329 stop:601 length:273 start_codon:yes stop_codon:yes gene_type:complete
MKLKIEKNIPIPSSHPKSKFLDIITKMKIGDSVFIESKESYMYNDKKAASFMNALRNHHNKTNRGKFGVIQRRVENGFRIWVVQRDNVKN